MQLKEPTMTRENSNSIFDLACKTFPHLAFSGANTWGTLVVALSVSIAAACFYNSNDYSGLLNSVLPILIGFNGSILGLVLAGFGFAALPEKTWTLFAVTEAPKNGKFSYLKNKLLIFFKVIFWIFLCSFFIVAVFLFCSFYRSLSTEYALHQIPSKAIRVFLVTFPVAWAQVKIFVELKIFIFTVYSTTLTQAQGLALLEKQDPFDKTNN